MVSTSINGVDSIVSQNARAGLSKTKTSGTDFSAVLSKSVANNMSDSKSNSAMTDISAKKTDVSSKTDSKKNASDNVKADDSSKTKKTDDIKDDKLCDAKDGEIAEKLEEAGENVYEEIKDSFELTDEQLRQLMENLGFTMADLLVPTNITALIIQVTGSQDAMSIITDDALSANFMQVMDVLTQELENLSAQTDISVEDIKGIIEAAADMDAEDAVIADDVISSDVQTDNEVQNAEADNTSDNSIENVIAKKLVTEGDKENTSGDSQYGNGKSDAKSDIVKNDTAAPTVNTTISDIQKSFEAAFEKVDSRVNAADVIDQIVDSIKLNSTTELKSMEIQLNPQNLGKVNLLVSVREGVVTAQIAAENEQVKRALEGQLLTLKENIQNQGIKVDAVEIMVQTNAFETNQQFNDNKQQQERKALRKIKLDGFDYTDDDSNDETENINYNENSSVEYMA